jgi:hypothetical protein
MLEYHELIKYETYFRIGDSVLGNHGDTHIMATGDTHNPEGSISSCVLVSAYKAKGSEGW